MFVRSSPNFDASSHFAVTIRFTEPLCVFRPNVRFSDELSVQRKGSFLLFNRNAGFRCCSPRSKTDPQRHIFPVCQTRHQRCHKKLNLLARIETETGTTLWLILDVKQKMLVSIQKLPIHHFLLSRSVCFHVSEIQ